MYISYGWGSPGENATSECNANHLINIVEFLEKYPEAPNGEKSFVGQLMVSFLINKKTQIVLFLTRISCMSYSDTTQPRLAMTLCVCYLYIRVVFTVLLYLTFVYSAPQIPIQELHNGTRQWELIRDTDTKKKIQGDIATVRRSLGVQFLPLSNALFETLPFFYQNVINILETSWADLDVRSATYTELLISLEIRTIDS